MMQSGSDASRHGSSRTPFLSLYQAGKPFWATAPRWASPGVPGAVGESPVTAPPGLAMATAQAPSANSSDRNTMFRRERPAMQPADETGT